MQVGLLWYDDDPKKTLGTKIEQAQARYVEKYGHTPNACYINPEANALDTKKHGLRIVPARGVRPNYLWIGVDEGE
jgi:hypothetical protein